MKKYLVLDAQVLQTPALHRGMGKYSLEFIQGLVKEGVMRRWDELCVVASSLLEQESGVSKQQLEALLPKEVRIEMLPLLRNTVPSTSVIAQNQKIIDDFIQTTFGDAKIDFMTLSPMQGEIGTVFPSLETVTNIALCYDLIPLMFWETYLLNPITADEYMSKLKQLLAADMYVCISKTCANDIALFLGVDRSRIVSIDGGPIDHSQKETPYLVKKPFFLMPTGNDLRKNNENAIKAFALFNERHGNKYQLVVTSYFKDYQVKEYQALSKDVVFTGNVNGDELAYLYNHMDGLLFVPHYEGLGLPLLEAMKAKKPIVCSDISVFREMTTKGVVYCDQHDIESIAAGLSTVTAKGYRIVQSEYKRVLGQYNWGVTIDRFMDFLKNYALQNYNRTAKTKLSVMAPAAINDTVGYGLMAQLLHADLSREFSPVYTLSLAERAQQRAGYIPYIAPTNYEALAFGENVLYVIGNTANCGNILQQALAVPGVVVLCDDSLEAVWGALVQKGLVHGDRKHLEESLNQLTGDTGYLGSLLGAGHSDIVVFNKPLKKRIEKIAHQLGCSVRVTLAAWPTPSLPYPEILPAKEFSVGYVGSAPLTKRARDGQRYIEPAYDYVQFDAIARCKQFHTPESYEGALAVSLGCTLVDVQGREQEENTMTTREFVEAIAAIVTRREA